MKRTKKITISVAGINVVLAFSLLISIATATIQISNYPNPFSPRTTSTTIAFYVFDEATVSAVIYDLTGAEVKRFAENVYPTGEHTEIWDGKNETGEKVAKGGYILRLTIRYASGRREFAIRKIGVL